ncbi:MAG: hypothetical protein ACQETL_05065 [Bacteroidota bacterium]
MAILLFNLRSMNSFNIFSGLLFFLLFTFQSHAQMQHEKVNKALASGQFSLNDIGIKGLGGKNIYLDLESKSFDSVTLHFEAGLVLVPQNENFQALMLIQEQAVVFGPKELLRIYLMGYCINPSKAGPRKQATYNKWELASPDLRDLAKTMNEYPVQKAQRIIWDFIDHNNFNRIYINAVLNNSKYRYKPNPACV